MKSADLITAVKGFFSDNKAQNRDSSNMIALITLAIQMLPTVTAGVTDLIRFIMEQRTILQQSSEWTAQMEADFRAALLASGSSAEFLTDSATGVSSPAAAPTPPTPPTPSTAAPTPPTPSMAGPTPPTPPTPSTAAPPPPAGPLVPFNEVVSLDPR